MKKIRSNMYWKNGNLHKHEVYSPSSKLPKNRIEVLLTKIFLAIAVVYFVGHTAPGVAVDVIDWLLKKSESVKF